jgi:anti-sigma regulatory factor (Ser/Thr protein kinase)
MTEDAVLLVSELVGNAVRHAVQPVDGDISGRRVTVGLWLQGSAAVRVEVQDDDPRMPRRGENHDALDTEGRGLWIIDQLADGLWWGRTRRGGKAVCCRFDLVRYLDD